MPAEHSNGTFLALFGMGVTWLVGAVGSHVWQGAKISEVDKREQSNHDATQKTIDAMEDRHTKSMDQMNENFSYIRDRIDKVIDKKGD